MAFEFYLPYRTKHNVDLMISELSVNNFQLNLIKNHQNRHFFLGEIQSYSPERKRFYSVETKEINFKINLVF